VRCRRRRQTRWRLRNATAGIATLPRGCANTADGPMEDSAPSTRRTAEIGCATPDNVAFIETSRGLLKRSGAKRIANSQPDPTTTCLVWLTTHGTCLLPYHEVNADCFYWRDPAARGAYHVCFLIGFGT
jgi:hypothetical protein